MSKIKIFLFSIIGFIFIVTILYASRNQVTLESCLADSATVESIAGGCPYFLNNEETDIVLTKGILKYDSNIIRQSYLAFFTEGTNIELYNSKKRYIMNECIEKGGCELSYIDAYEHGRFGLPIDLEKSISMYKKLLKKNENNFVLYQSYFISMLVFLSDYQHMVDREDLLLKYDKYLEFSLSRDHQSSYFDKENVERLLKNLNIYVNEVENIYLDRG